MSKIEITKEDLEDKVLRANAETIWNSETVRPLTKHNLFNSTVYTLLSSRENFRNLMRMVSELKKHKIDSPDKFIQNQDIVKLIVPGDETKDKAKHLIGMSRWWKKSRIAQRIMDDYNGRRELAKAFRKEFIKDALGMGYKCTSLLLRMIGYEDVSPPDIWALRYLRDNGYDVIDPDKDEHSGAAKRRAPAPNPLQIELFPDLERKPKRHYYQAGPTDAQSERYESYLAIEAAKFGFTPARFQCFLWAKYSSWNDVQPINKGTQLELFKKRHYSKIVKK